MLLNIIIKVTLVGILTHLFSYVNLLMKIADSKKVEEQKMNEIKEFKYIDEKFYDGVRKVLEDARKRVYTSIQSEMVFAYWQIGKMIVDKQGGESRAKYGDGLIKELSVELTKDYGKGFDESNLRRIRQFYILFKNRATVCHELSWSHYRLLISLDDENARNST